MGFFLRGIPASNVSQSISRLFLIAITTSPAFSSHTPATQIRKYAEWLAELWLPCYPRGDPLVRSVLLIRLVKFAHRLIWLYQREINGANAVEEFLMELRQIVREASGTLNEGSEDWLMV